MEAFKKKFISPHIEYWPEVRWWLAEGLHTDETLKKDLQMLYDSGFGAVEFLAMDEEGADSSLYGWGSEEWVHDTKLIIREATKKGMGVSLTSGTNWANANLTTITPDDKAASNELNYTAEIVPAGQTRTGILKKGEINQPNVHRQDLVAVVAAKRVDHQGNMVYLDKDTSIVLTDKVQDENGEKTLTFTAPEDGDYELITFWIHGTGQIATPSVSVSYTVNYFDRYGVEAVIDYWDKEVLTPDMLEYIKKNGRIQLYMDSLEIFPFTKGGTLWGYHLLDEFKERRGYDLTPYLPYVLKISDGNDENNILGAYEDHDTEFVEKLRNDLFQTMTELYIDNMLKPLQKWLHSKGMTLRAEISYGLPFEISIPGKYVDGIETESLEFTSQVDSFRNMAGPAHLFKKQYSSETGATLYNYSLGMNFYTQIIFTQFAAGVARTVLHGYSSIAGSEGSTYWPGHEGMVYNVSERFGCRQPAFRHYNDWTDMLARFQFILRQGKPRVDLGILRLDYRFNHCLFRDDEKEIYETKFLRANEGIYWKDMNLQNNGYTYDYFAPQVLEDEGVTFEDGLISPDGPGYKALIIYQEQMPLSSAKQILKWARQGLPVVIVNGAAEMVRNDIYKTHIKAASKTPFNDGMDNELREVMSAMKALDNVIEVDDQGETIYALRSLGIYQRAKFTQPNKNILTFMRDEGNIRYLYVYNYMYTQSEEFTFEVAIEGLGKPYRINCWSGDIDELGLYRHEDGRTVVKLTLKPGEATVIGLKLDEKDEIYATDSNAEEILISNDGLVAYIAENGTFNARLSDGSIVTKEVEGLQEIELDEWDLVVEDWNEGEKVTITEDRGLGYITKEVYYKTKKTKIIVGKTKLLPWKDIPQVGPHVSGVGYYTVEFDFPENINDDHIVMFNIGSTNDNTAAVYVNDKKAPPVDFTNPVVDITRLLKEGKNTIKVEVSSTLNNRLKQRGYYENHLTYDGWFKGTKEKMKTYVKDYGMTGRTYIKILEKNIIK